MNVTISPGTVEGEIFAPASKSSMQRACAAALICGGPALIRNPGQSGDDRAAIGVIRALGATVSQTPEGTLRVESRGIAPVTGYVNCGESGLGLRMFAPLVASTWKPMVIEGAGSLLNRPMDFFDSVFPALGIKITSNQGRLPLQVQGPLVPADIVTDGSLSSQFLTGLLMAYAAADACGVTITVDNLKSRPYIDLTLKVMREFRLKVPENRGYTRFYFSPEPFHRAAGVADYTVEGDWSGGAFLLVAAAIAGRAVVRGLDPSSTQADKAILSALELAGADVVVQPGAIDVGRSSDGRLKAFHFDATDCPDLFPPLVALAACCEGSSFIRGAGRLAHKESDRALTLREEFGKLGVDILVNGDIMGVKGVAALRPGEVHSRHDHRIAMAAAVAALRADGPVLIEKAEAIDKSYPGFFGDLGKLGITVSTLKEQF